MVHVKKIVAYWSCHEIHSPTLEQALQFWHLSGLVQIQGTWGVILWSIKLETFKIQHYTDFKKCRNFQRLDLMLFCSVNLQKGSRRFPTSKIYLEWCKQLQKTWLKTQGFHVYLQVIWEAASLQRGARGR